MKFLVGVDIGNYSFNVATKTITFSNLPDLVSQEQILLVTNVKTGTVIYQFNSYDLGGTFSGGVLTLRTDLSGMTDTDPLQIFIEYPHPMNVESLLRKGVAGGERSRFDTSHVYNPETFFPRNHMFNINTREILNNTQQYPTLPLEWVDLNWITDYPTSVVGNGNNNDYPDGFNVLFYHNPTMTNESGFYVYPKQNRTLYIKEIHVMCEVANRTDVSKPIDKNGQVMIWSHSGSEYCRARTISDLTTIADFSFVRPSLFNPNMWTYKYIVRSEPPGRIVGDSGDYFQIKMSGDSFPDNDYMTSLYFFFKMWELHTDKE